MLNVAGDAWLLDLENRHWAQLHMPSTSKRLWHTGCQSVDGDILVFGGCRNNILNIQETTVCIINKSVTKLLTIINVQDCKNAPVP